MLKTTALECELHWIHEYTKAGAQLLNIAGITSPYTWSIKKRRAAKQRLAATGLKQMRESLGLSQEGLACRTRSISVRTIRNAEAVQRVTFETARQILEAINTIHVEVCRAAVTIDDLGLTLR